MAANTADLPDIRYRAPLWILLLMAALAILNALGFSEAVAGIAVYHVNALDLPFPPILGITLPLIFCVIFCSVCIGMAWRKAWAFQRVAPLITLYAASRLLLLIGFAQSDYDRGRLGAQSALTVVVIALVWLYAWRKGWTNATH